MSSKLYIYIHEVVKSCSHLKQNFTLIKISVSHSLPWLPRILNSERTLTPKFNCIILWNSYAWFKHRSIHPIYGECSSPRSTLDLLQGLLLSFSYPKSFQSENLSQTQACTSLWLLLSADHISKLVRFGRHRKLSGTPNNFSPNLNKEMDEITSGTYLLFYAVSLLNTPVVHVHAP